MIALANYRNTWKITPFAEIKRIYMLKTDEINYFYITTFN